MKKIGWTMVLTILLGSNLSAVGLILGIITGEVVLFGLIFLVGIILDVIGGGMAILFLILRIAHRNSGKT